MKRPTCIDLFCGCGGFSLGFINAGFDVLLGLDSDCAALTTYAYNLGADNLKWIGELPKKPIEAKTARATAVYKRKFEEKYGEGAVELDALEALYPGKFEEIVKGHILQYFDIDAHNAIVKENRRITDFIKPIVAEHLKTLVLPPYESTFEFPESELEVDEDDESWLYDSTLDYSDQLARYKSLYKDEEDEEDGKD